MRAFFPDINNRNFQFGDDVGITAINLIVEGSPAHGQSPVSSITTSISDAGPSSSGSAPLPRPFFSSCRRMQSVNVKVVQARMKKSQTGIVEFTPLFVNVTESTVNVGHITNVMQEKWGYDHVVVTSDGLKVEESAGTRGTFMLLLLTSLSIMSLLSVRITWLSCTCKLLPLALPPFCTCRAEILESRQQEDVCH